MSLGSRPIREARHFVTALALLAVALCALPATARADGTVYVTDSGGISQYAIGAGGLLAPLAPATVVDGMSHGSIAIAPNGKSAYIACSQGAFLGGASGVCQYDINPRTGALSPKTPASVATDAAPTQVTVTPDGRSVYVTAGLNTRSVHPGTVSQYNVDPHSGALSPKTPATVDAGPVATAIAVTPDGTSAYVTHYFLDLFGPGIGIPPNPISQFDIDSHTGALSPKSPPTVPAGPESSIAVTPDGRSAYSEGVRQYDIDPHTGALSPKSPPSIPSVTGPPVVGGTSPLALAVTPDGKSVYVINIYFRGWDTISQFSIDPRSGTLSPKTPAAVGGFGSEWGQDIEGIAVAPDSRSVYLTNHTRRDQGGFDGGKGVIAQYDINPISGALSPKSPATVPTGDFPGHIAVGPLPRFPSAKGQCKHGGWRNFPQFKNQGQCVASVEHGR